MTQHPLPEGTMVRLTRDVEDLSGTHQWRAGFTFITSDYVEPNDPPEEGEITEPIYYGNTNGGYSNVCVPADAVEVSLTAEAVSARKVPTVDAILDSLRSELCGLRGDGFETDETEPIDDDRIGVTGTTTEGLRFSAVVIVRDVRVADF